MAAQVATQFELFAVLPEHRLVLCITPKAASMSIIDALSRHYSVSVQKPSHRYSVFRWMTLEQVQVAVPDWPRAQFVRHPLDRLRSVYDYHILKSHLERSSNLRERFTPGMSFRLFVDRVLEEPDYDSHYLPQCEMTDRVDYLGKFENLSDDWRDFRDWAGVDLPDLQHINANRKTTGCSLSELTEYQRRRLNEIYAGDFERYGYRP